MITLFTYGSILLPEMTNEFFGVRFLPYKSVFIRGFKIILKNSNSKKYPEYHNIIISQTYNKDDIIPGFLVKIPSNIIDKVDDWEGINYSRNTIFCFDKNLNKIECDAYMLNKNIKI